MKLPSCCEQTQLRAYDSDGQIDSYDIAGFCLCEASLMRRTIDVLVLTVLSSGRGGSQVKLSVFWKNANASMSEFLTC